MTEKKESPWNMLNLFFWANGFLQLIGFVFGPILRLLGFSKPKMPTTAHDNTQLADVDDAARLAAEVHAAVDELVKTMSPAELVHAYCRASEDDRLTMDLSALSEWEQDWLLNLSTADLIMLGSSGVGACERSLEHRMVLPNFARIREPEAEAVEIPTIPTAEDLEERKRNHVREQFHELLRGLAKPQPKPVFDTNLGTGATYAETARRSSQAVFDLEASECFIQFGDFVHDIAELGDEAAVGKIMDHLNAFLSYGRYVPGAERVRSSDDGSRLQERRSVLRLRLPCGQDRQHANAPRRDRPRTDAQRVLHGARPLSQAHS